MNLFGSEEHLEQWLEGARARRDDERRKTVRPGAGAWYADRLDPAWQPHTQEQNQAIPERLGLTEDFWRLG
jgi:hypothetical protein